MSCDDINCLFLHDYNFVYTGFRSIADNEWAVKKVGVKEVEIGCFEGFLSDNVLYYSIVTSIT